MRYLIPPTSPHQGANATGNADREPAQLLGTIQER
jgi:hypothetical protein